MAALLPPAGHKRAGLRHLRPASHQLSSPGSGGLQKPHKCAALLCAGASPTESHPRCAHLQRAGEGASRELQQLLPKGINRPFLATLVFLLF